VSLPRAYRLRHRQDFQQVYQKGRRRVSTYLSVNVLPSSPQPQGRSGSLPPSRFGIVISKKVSKKAVVRNRVKRRLKGALRELKSQLAPGLMAVIVCRSEITGCDYDEILRELKKLLILLEVIDGH
jgi:ribonuclease P protein component